MLLQHLGYSWTVSHHALRSTCICPWCLLLCTCLGVLCILASALSSLHICPVIECNS